MKREEVSKYFDLLENTLKDNYLFDKPGNIFNVDESGLQLNNKPDKVIAMKGSKDVHVLTSGEKGETVTLVACCNAEGNFLPPYCIFKGVNKKQEYGDGLPASWFENFQRKENRLTLMQTYSWIGCRIILPQESQLVKFCSF